jgi:FAD:protein FMN transferase
MSRVDANFPTMGGRAAIRLESDGLSREDLEGGVHRIENLFAEVEATLSRFRADSELTRLNADPRPAVPASPLVRELAGAVRWAGTRSGGLVDGTLLDGLEGQGYVTTLAGRTPAPLADALAAAPPRRAARPHPARDYARIHVDDEGRVVRRAGLRIDAGGLGKGLAADIAAATLPASVRYAIGCGGDLAVGGPGARPWEIAVTGAHTGGEVHRLHVRSGGVATSGIHARLWRRPDGSYAHHLLDPRTGEPAWTGLVAVTAVGGSALEAEVLAKTALLSGPARARRLLEARGGVLQHDDGRVEVIFGPPVVRLPRPRTRTAA